MYKYSIVLYIDDMMLVCAVPVIHCSVDAIIPTHTALS